MSTKPLSKSRIMRAKAKKTTLCPVSLLAIELKGLAAPGEALKNFIMGLGRRRQALASNFITGFPVHQKKGSKAAV